MTIARSFAAAAAFGPCALTVGNFDGVHLGHRRLLCATIKAAQESGLNPVVLTFDPHPLAVVAPGRVPRLLTSVEERCEIFAQLGIERILILPFTPEIAALSSEEFAGYLKDPLRAQVVVVGENFRFGHKHAGTADTLSALGVQLGIETRILPGVRSRGCLVSSSEIRKLIDAGRVEKACRLLARPHALSGDVVRGHGIGARETVPTLNLSTSAQVLPKEGVYITRTRDLAGARAWNSITNVGHRPTFGMAEPLSIETFLIEPLDDAAPERIRVEFLHRVRDERKFPDAAALKTQILRDAGRAQAYFHRLDRWVRKNLK
jgi:riboflavin kinase/FMN adenylyltransferase